ncbi:MAG: hypothetical protein P1U74_05740 [Legionellaceae bacterium]|nr:hypothetical protein [Legionellaceae bacterium]
MRNKSISKSVSSRFDDKATKKANAVLDEFFGEKMQESLFDEFQSCKSLGRLTTVDVFSPTILDDNLTSDRFMNHINKKSPSIYELNAAGEPKLKSTKSPNKQEKEFYDILQGGESYSPLRELSAREIFIYQMAYSKYINSDERAHKNRTQSKDAFAKVMQDNILYNRYAEFDVYIERTIADPSLEPESPPPHDFETIALLKQLKKDIQSDRSLNVLQKLRLMEDLKTCAIDANLSPQNLDPKDVNYPVVYTQFPQTVNRFKFKIQIEEAREYLKTKFISLNDDIDFNMAIEDKKNCFIYHEKKLYHISTDKRLQEIEITTEQSRKIDALEIEQGSESTQDLHPILGKQYPNDPNLKLAHEIINKAAKGTGTIELMQASIERCFGRAGDSMVANFITKRSQPSQKTYDIKSQEAEALQTQRAVYQAWRADLGSSVRGVSTEQGIQALKLAKDIVDSEFTTDESIQSQKCGFVTRIGGVAPKSGDESLKSYLPGTDNFYFYHNDQNNHSKKLYYVQIKEGSVIVSPPLDIIVKYQRAEKQFFSDLDKTIANHGNVSDIDDRVAEYITQNTGHVGRAYSVHNEKIQKYRYNQKSNRLSHLIAKRKEGAEIYFDLLAQQLEGKDGNYIKLNDDIPPDRMVDGDMHYYLHDNGTRITTYYLNRTGDIVSNDEPIRDFYERLHIDVSVFSEKVVEVVTLSKEKFSELTKLVENKKVGKSDFPFERGVQYKSADPSSKVSIWCSEIGDIIIDVEINKSKYNNIKDQLDKSPNSSFTKEAGKRYIDTETIPPRSITFNKDGRPFFTGSTPYTPAPLLSTKFLDKCQEAQQSLQRIEDSNRSYFNLPRNIVPIETRTRMLNMLTECVENPESARSKQYLTDSYSVTIVNGPIDESEMKAMGEGTQRFFFYPAIDNKHDYLNDRPATICYVNARNEIVRDEFSDGVKGKLVRAYAKEFEDFVRNKGNNTSGSNTFKLSSSEVYHKISTRVAKKSDEFKMGSLSEEVEKVMTDEKLQSALMAVAYLLGGLALIAAGVLMIMGVFTIPVGLTSLFGGLGVVMTMSAEISSIVYGAFMVKSAISNNPATQPEIYKLQKTLYELQSPELKNDSAPADDKKDYGSIMGCLGMGN